MNRTCVIYTRVSTEMQVDGYSLSAQINILEGYAKAHDLDIVEYYQDAGKSGKDIKGRPDFRRMLSDISNHVIQVDYVLVFKLSRFGRSSLDTLTSLKVLQENGTELVCVKDGIDTSSSMGKLILTLLSCISEMERENIIVQTAEGKKEKARQGKWSGGFAPYGYRIGDDGVLCIVEEERPVVEMIFDLYVNKDWGCRRIAQYLNNIGVCKDTHGRKNRLQTWTVSIIRQIISSEVYYGMIAYGKHMRVKDNEGAEHTVRTDKYLVSKGQHEGIISEEIWMRAQRKRKVREDERKIKYGGENVSILSGILKCPVCGSPMHMSTSRKKNGAEYNYYRCGGNRNKTGCNYGRNFRQSDIDSQVFKAVCQIVDYEQFTEEIHAKLKQETDMEQLEVQIKAVSKALKNTRNNKMKLEQEIDALSYDTPHYKRKREDLMRRLDMLYDKEEEQEELADSLNVKRENINNNKIKEDIIYGTLRNFTSLYEKFSDEEKKRFCNLLMERVELYEEPLENGQCVKSISFKFPLIDGGNRINGTDDLLNVKVEVPILEMSERHVAYNEIIEYVKEKYGVTIYKNYITDVKSKYGLPTRQNPARLKKRRHCTKEAEPCIVDALKHFGLL